MHAVVKVDKKGMRLYDTGGSGGTRVNGTLLASKSVDSNSSIRVGKTELQLVNTDALPAAALNGETLHDLRGNHLGVIIVTSGPDSGKSFKVSEGDNMIGRGIDCKISLADDTVSRNHAVIRCYNGKMSIFDVVSESGTLIDGQLIEQEALKDGDVIAAGQSEFTVMAPISQGKGV
jgi:pSer/pThr/pTyr-binding forkhead associated (FHA) protein